MNPNDKPAITVVHSLPGRVRARLSNPLLDPGQLIAAVREHPGMGDIRYSPATRSLLIHFDPHVISTEEITLRAAFHYAIEQGGRPIRLLAAPEHVVLQDSAVYAAIGLATASAMRWLNPGAKSPSRLDWLAGAGTACSVIDHAWREVRGRGYFDPEVLSLAYLATGFVRGNLLTASAITWLTTFGRHLIESPTTAVEVTPRLIATEDPGEVRYEVVLSPDADAPDRLRLGIVGMLNSALKYGMTGGGSYGLRSLWEELHDVSRVHGEVLEGYGRTRNGIPIRFH